jgi:integral membrane sensor domain MASE1
MIYTLTTRMRHENRQDHNALLIACAVIECIAFSAAAVVQFDNIDEVYTLHRTAMWLTLLGGILSLAPVGIKLHTSIGHSTSHSPRRRDTLVYHALPRRSNIQAKLKL